MVFTLYIDESGDFETHKGEWVVAGLLCRGAVSEVDETLSAALDPLVIAGDLPPRHDCHLTDLHRSNGHYGANLMCRTLIDKLFASGESIQPLLIGAVNEAKRRVADPERTYRTMVLDLVALVDAAVGRYESIDRFDLVVATRTRNSVRLTTSADLSHHFRDSIHQQFEVGLASRGLLDSFSSDAIRIHFRYANDAWGTVVADFVANTIFNRRHRDRGVLLSEWSRSSRLTVFESLGSYEERRARIAERDGDLAAALGRWAATPGNSSRIRSARADGVERVWRRILKQTGVGGPTASLEAVIEWLRSQCHDAESLLSALRALEAGLNSASRQSPHPACDSLLFRLRNFYLLKVNHAGSTAEADRLIMEQEKLHATLSRGPEVFPHLLDYGAHKVEAAVNKLDFESAASLADRHLALIDNYLAAWSLFAGSPQDEPRWLLRSVMMLVRARALSWHGAADVREVQFALALLDAQRPMHDRDRSRLFCYRIMVMLHAGYLNQALSTCTSSTESSSDPYILFWSARTLADCLLGGIKIPSEFSNVLLAKIEEELVVAGDGHPAHLLWRELGVLQLMVRSNRKTANHCFQRAITLSAEMRSRNPIGAWLNGLARQHQDFLLSRAENPASYFEGDFSESCTRLLNRCSTAVTQEQTFLTAMRRTSPY